MSNQNTAVPTDPPEPTTKANLSKRQALALTDEHVKRIATAAYKVVPTRPKLEAVCSDGVTREFLSLEKLLEYDNASTRRLEVISITAEQHSPLERKFVLTIGRKGQNILGEIVAGETIRESAIREVLDALKDAQPWHAVIACYSLLLLIILPMAPIVFCSLLLSATSFQVIPYTKAMYGIMDTASRLFVLALILVWPLHKVISYLFPLNAILIGAGKDRDKKLEIWRQITICFVIMLIGGFLFEFWFHR